MAQQQIRVAHACAGVEQRPRRFDRPPPGPSPSPRWIVQFAKACAARKRRVALSDVATFADRRHRRARSSGIAANRQSASFAPIVNADDAVAGKRRTDVRRERAVARRPLNQPLNARAARVQALRPRPARCQQNFDGRGFDSHHDSQSISMSAAAAAAAPCARPGRCIRRLGGNAAGSRRSPFVRDPHLRASRYGKARYGGHARR